MRTIHLFPNTNNALIIEEDELRPWSSLGDYSEFEDNALSVEKNSRSLRNIHTELFSNNNSLMGSLYDELNTNIGSYTEPMARNARANWDLNVAVISGTHGNLKPVDFNQIAWDIWESRWKPVYLSHINWLEQRLQEKDYVLREYFEDIASNITYSNFSIFECLEVDIDDILIDSVTETLVRLTSVWINHLKSEVSTEKQNFTVDTLDQFMEFFHEMDICSSTFDLHSQDGDPKFNIVDLMRETAVDLYINKNPNVFLADITEGRDNYRITVFDSSEIVHNASNVDEANALIVAESKEQAESVEQGINQYLNGEWYWAKAIKFIPKEEWTQYEAADLEKDPEHGFYIDLEDSCGGFESEEAVIENFSYLGESSEADD